MHFINFISLAEENMGMWTDFLYRIDLDAEDVITSNSKLIMENYIQNNQHTEVWKNIDKCTFY